MIIKKTYLKDKIDFKNYNNQEIFNFLFIFYLFYTKKLNYL